MIRIRLRTNLLYLLVFLVAYYAHKLISLLIDIIFNFEAPYIFLFMMTFGEIIGGATIYLFQITNRRKKKEVKYLGIQLIHNKEYKNSDGIIKIIILFFLSSFFLFL